MFYFNEYDYQYYLYSHHCIYHCIYLLICWVEDLAVINDLLSLKCMPGTVLSSEDMMIKMAKPTGFW